MSGQPHAMADLSQENSLMYSLNRRFGVPQSRRFVKPTSDRLTYTAWQKFTDSLWNACIYPEKSILLELQ